jgi:hypothetical protein
MPECRLIAYYLPQFHPIPENDEWWGMGFTEWTNVAKARPLFRNHFQPRLPADLGFYDLRVPEVRELQAKMASEAGVFGFCYWHYWFNGKELLERPFREVVESGKPDFPFCLAWANETWTGVWHGAPHKVLIQQTYGGRADNERHFYSLLPAFSDPRYVAVGGKPFFLIYRPMLFDDFRAFSDDWNGLAAKNGLPGFAFGGITHFMDEHEKLKSAGFDVVINNTVLKYGIEKTRANNVARGINKYVLKRPYNVIPYAKIAPHMMEHNTYHARNGCIPTVLPNWDNSPRSGVRGTIVHGCDPAIFAETLRSALADAKGLSENMVFLKSWNEWAEGNYVEPDARYGRDYLRVIRQELERARS